MHSNNNPTTQTTNAKLKVLFIGILLILATAMLRLTTLAQDHASHQQDHTGTQVVIGKKGEMHLTESVKIGDTVLAAGMYQVQHIEQGSEHVVVFKEMTMPAGYKMSNTPVGKEVARVTCKVEPLDTKARKTKVLLRTNTRGEKEVVEVQVVGEAFRHLL